MEEKYIIAIDQSTQGTKAILYDNKGDIIGRQDIAHKQIVNELGYVSHDGEEIYANTLTAVKLLLENTKADTGKICGVGISNQRETSLIWNRHTGKAVEYAVVWQCSRGQSIIEGITKKEGEYIKSTTGIYPSPYFPAAKLAWLNNHHHKDKKDLCYGTMDSFLVYRLTNRQSYATDYSNASRTQLFNINSLKWDEGICKLFGIDADALPKVFDSNANFGYTNFEGLLKQEVPIHSVMGDSHSALFAQGCFEVGSIKATYGTGSSVMMNIGKAPFATKNGVVCSIGWGVGGEATYVLEGNINYTGGVISWLKNNLGIITDASSTQEMAKMANKEDTTYFVPAFTGLSAPYFNNKAKAIICGMTPTTGKNEVVKSALESIGFQISDVIDAMREASSINLTTLKADGGATKNGYLMQFQSDICGIEVHASKIEELSATGVAYMAGLALGVYDKRVFSCVEYERFLPTASMDWVSKKKQGWRDAVCLVVSG